MKELATPVEKCKNCFGSGTVFGNRKKLTVKGSRVCPVCNGSCKVPVLPEKVARKGAKT